MCIRDSSRVKREEDLNKVDVVLSSLYDYFLEHVEALPEDLQVIAALDGTNEAGKDYIACLLYTSRCV